MRAEQWQPLSDVKRTDILRAAIGYALGEDALGLACFREKYAAKKAATPDARAFEIFSALLDANGTEFRDIAHAVAFVDYTLEGFPREMQIHYPDASTAPAPAAALGRRLPLTHRQPLTLRLYRRRRQRGPLDAARNAERNQKPEKLQLLNSDS